MGYEETMDHLKDRADEQAEAESIQAEQESMFQQDSERLNWLSRQISFNGLYCWPRWDPTSAHPDCDWAWFTADRKGPFETMRDAIDAAMKGGKS